MPDITLFHNPDCGTSRKVPPPIRHAGIEPDEVVVVEGKRHAGS